jgi:hypothetical protein
MWRLFLLGAFAGIPCAATPVSPHPVEARPSTQTENQKEDVSLSFKKAILKKPLSMKIKPYKKSFSFNIDESTLNVPTRSNKKKARIHAKKVEVTPKDDVTIRKPWDLTNHWDPRKDDQGRPWSRDMDTIAGAAVRSAVPEKPEPFFGFGITKSIDTQAK